MPASPLPQRCDSALPFSHQCSLRYPALTLFCFLYLEGCSQTVREDQLEEPYLPIPGSLISSSSPRCNQFNVFLFFFFFFFALALYPPLFISCFPFCAQPRMEWNPSLQPYSDLRVLALFCFPILQTRIFSPFLKSPRIFPNSSSLD